MSQNAYSNLQAIKATTPEQLTEFIRSIRVAFELISIVYDGKAHVAYFRSHHKITIKNRQVESERRGAL